MMNDPRYLGTILRACSDFDTKHRGAQLGRFACSVVKHFADRVACANKPAVTPAGVNTTDRFYEQYVFCYRSVTGTYR